MSEAAETHAIRRGGQEAGAYLETIGQTDLAQLTQDQWATFCRTLFVATCDELQRIADDEIPF